MKRRIDSAQKLKLSALREALDKDASAKSLDHYGSNCIAAALGEDTLAQLLDVQQWERGGVFVPSSSTEGLQHALVGFSAEGSARRPVAVVIAGFVAAGLAMLPHLEPDARRAGENLILRSGLMRRSTATMLSETLAQQTAYANDLSWEVLEGPSVEDSVRSWLDQRIGATNSVLQFVHGWCLPEVIGTSLTLFRLASRLPGHDSTAISENQLLDPPPRYILTGLMYGGKDGLPDSYEVWVRRSEPEEAAHELVSQLESAGTLYQGLASTQPRLSKLSSAFAQELWPMYEVDRHLGIEARAYASAFTAAELADVVESLKRQGVSEIRALDWRTRPPEGPKSCHDQQFLRQRTYEKTTWLTTGRVSGVEVRFWSVIDLPMHLPESEWPMWALESKRELMASVLDQEWQQREQIRDYLEDVDRG